MLRLGMQTEPLCGSGRWSVSDWVTTRSARRYTQVSGWQRHPGRDCRDPEAMDGNVQAGSKSCNAGTA